MEKIEALIRQLGDEDESVSRRAVRELAAIGGEKTVALLINALKGPDWYVRVRAADALGTIRDRSGAP
ncbi:MAG: HEAT repeat domain-containing protein [Deltaproteobacteria bacterium]|nr:HEAT repeat domain-containing protein [Deltaproteobacteria bacterium]